MSNIFENAKFGDKFRTRDGRMALFIEAKYEPCHDRVYLFLEGNKSITEYTPNGEGIYVVCQDIVSRWEEPIDEEELDRLARECSTSLHGFDNDYEAERLDVEYGFKVGYRKAKGE